MEKTWDADGRIRDRRDFTQEDLSAYLRDAEQFGWTKLDLSVTRIRELPASIGQLSSLQALYLTRTQIWELPASIGQLANLQTLDLSRTQIRELPDSIGQLENLQTLFLYGTQIGELPTSIGQLANLQTLDLDGTQIGELPDSIGQLENLQTLFLYGTQIGELPASVGQLANLQTLDLSFTSIRELPDSIGQLANLQTLNLSGCHLKEIPYGVVKLGLPFVIDDVSADKCVNLTGVTLDKGDITLFAQPREVIEAYYRDRVREEMNECKVIFLGDGAAGKSSLIERIIHDKFEDGALPTDGVKTTKWTRRPDGTPLTLENGKPLTIRFLDFGGQEIMHSMHRCFLTSHTVYVVVCESRDDAELARVAARWMETVRAFAPDCPVILALNKSDLNPNVAVNERTLKALNPAYRHTIHTSAKRDDDPGVRQLTESVLREVPACLRQMSGNRGFLELKRELENMEEDYILPEQFRQRCEHFRISENLRQDLLNWFQDLGVAYAYALTFRRVYVLNPAWLTNGIYRLILRTPNGGFLRHSEIQDTLGKSYSGDVDPGKTYTPQEMEFILHIMRKFEISMRVTSEYEEDGVEMIPMKMTMTPPERYDEFRKSGALHLRWEAGYLPNNLAHRLMIRKYPELDPERALFDKCVWRTGGWFRSPDGGCDALAEMTDKALDVYVRGAHDARVYMDSFRQQVLRILGDLNIKAKEYVFYTAPDGGEGKVSYKAALNHYRQRKAEIYVEDLEAFVSPGRLLHENYVGAAMETRDFFISYTGENEARAQWIADVLRDEGYTAYLQKYDCGPGMDFLQWMEDAIAHSWGFLAVWSKAYEKSDYCRKELHAATVKQHESDCPLLPVRVEDAPMSNPLFKSVVRADLLSDSEEANRATLLKAVKHLNRF